MAATRIVSAAERLKDLPLLALPADYPRPQENRVVDASVVTNLPDAASKALLKLAVFTEEAEDDDQPPSSAFQCLLAAFIVLLHRYTGDADLLVASSSETSPDPLLLRVPIEPTDPFWAVPSTRWSLQSISTRDHKGVRNVPCFVCDSLTRRTTMTRLAPSFGALVRQPISLYLCRASPSQPASHWHHQSH